MSWHYAPSVEVIDGDEVWTVREVYVNNKGSIVGYSVHPDHAQGDCRGELVRCLEMMLADVRTRPALHLPLPGWGIGTDDEDGLTIVRGTD